MNIEDLKAEIVEVGNAWVQYMDDSFYSKNKDGQSLLDSLNANIELCNFKFNGTEVNGFVQCFKVEKFLHRRAKTPKSLFEIRVSFYNGIRAVQTVTEVRVDV